MSQDQEREEQDRLQAIATPAEDDLEFKLARLDMMMAARRKDPALERRYEVLRDEVVAYLREHGPRYYLDSEGFKHYAWAVVPEKVIINVGKMVEAVEAGELDPGVLAECAPRKANAEAFRRACQLERLTQAQIVDFTKVEEATGHVKTSAPELG